MFIEETLKHLLSGPEVAIHPELSYYEKPGYPNRRP